MHTISNTPSTSAQVNDCIRQAHFKLIEIVNEATTVQHEESIQEDNQTLKSVNKPALPVKKSVSFEKP